MNSMHAYFGFGTNDFIYVVLTLYLKEAHLFTFQNGRTCFHRLLRARASLQLEIFLAINFSVECVMCSSTFLLHSLNVQMHLMSTLTLTTRNACSRVI